MATLEKLYNKYNQLAIDEEINLDKYCDDDYEARHQTRRRIVIYKEIKRDIMNLINERNKENKK